MVPWMRCIVMLNRRWSIRRPIINPALPSGPGAPISNWLLKIWFGCTTQTFSGDSSLQLLRNCHVRNDSYSPMSSWEKRRIHQPIPKGRSNLGLGTPTLNCFQFRTYARNTEKLSLFPRLEELPQRMLAGHSNWRKNAVVTLSTLRCTWDFEIFTEKLLRSLTPFVFPNLAETTTPPTAW